ncbi:MAG: SAM-dependent methyltransferase [Elusimicrobiota bacterium]|jgi:SAM-dependent MidA family methyltransferase
MTRLSFAEYMDQTLYGPQGYYASGAAASGRAGDYFTAPDVSPVFGRLLAAIWMRWANEFAARPFHLVEMGAGEGHLARAIGAAIQKDHREQLGRLNYIAVERSPTRCRSLELLESSMPCPFRVLPDLSSLKASPLTGCFFANELIDAFPVHRVRNHQGRLQEAYVEQTASGKRLVWTDPSTSCLEAYFARIGIRLSPTRHPPQLLAGDLSSHGMMDSRPETAGNDGVRVEESWLPEGYETEINLAMGEWIRSVAASLSSGLVALIDYGRPAHEYYHPERSRGTLRGFIRHAVRSDVLSDEIMDMTADVDFTSLALDAQEAGLCPLAYMDMGSFLMTSARFLWENRLSFPAGSGGESIPNAKMDLLPVTAGDDGVGREWAGLRYLVHPEGLGSAFQVLVLGKGLDPRDWLFEGNRLSRLGLTNHD